MDAARSIRILSAEDPRISAFRDIRERDLRRARGEFIAEGTVVLRLLARAHAAAQGFEVVAVLVLENRLEGIADIIDAFPADVPVYVADRTVINEIAGFDIHRGVLALGRRLQTPSLADVLERLPEEALVVAAVGISNHDNIGAIFRNAAAFRADLVLLDETCCDPLYRKAIRVSVGSVLTVPYVQAGSTEAMLSALATGGFSIWGLSPRGTTDIRGIPASPRMCLLTGTEGEGLPEAIIASIDTAFIPQSEDLDSLNAATATGIALFCISGAMKRI